MRDVELLMLYLQRSVIPFVFLVDDKFPVPAELASKRLNPGLASTAFIEMGVEMGRNSSFTRPPESGGRVNDSRRLFENGGYSSNWAFILYAYAVYFLF